MTQLATPQTVVAPFDNVTLASRGREYRLEQEGEQFWVSMIDPEWVVVDRVGAVVVCLLILQASWKILRPAIDQLIDAVEP